MIIPVVLIGVEVSLLLLCCFNAPNGLLLLISSCKHQCFFSKSGAIILYVVLRSVMPAPQCLLH